jgi:hypothetical protein
MKLVEEAWFISTRLQCTSLQRLAMQRWMMQDLQGFLETQIMEATPKLHSRNTQPIHQCYSAFFQQITAITKRSNLFYAFLNLFFSEPRLPASFLIHKQLFFTTPTCIYSFLKALTCI